MQLTKPYVKTPLQIVSKSAQDLYYQTLCALKEGEEVASVKQKNSVGADWGNKDKPTKELRYMQLILENPRNRIVQTPFVLLENIVPRALVITLSDEHKLDVMQYYNPKASLFSDDGKVISTSYGYRMRHLEGVDQVRLIVKQIKEDPTTRRAIIHIHAVKDHEKKYTPCLDSLHFVLRKNRLECQAFWRSENALTLLPVNFFEFTLLQELIASELGVEVGRFVQSVTSLHYYQEDEARVQQTLSILESLPLSREMPSMPTGSFKQLSCLIAMEKALREQKPFPDALWQNLHPYWRELARVVHYFIERKKGRTTQALALAEQSIWKDLLVQKWE